MQQVWLHRSSSSRYRYAERHVCTFSPSPNRTIVASLAVTPLVQANLQACIKSMEESRASLLDFAASEPDAVRREELASVADLLLVDSRVLYAARGGGGGGGSDAVSTSRRKKQAGPSRAQRMSTDVRNLDHEVSTNAFHLSQLRPPLTDNTFVATTSTTGGARGCAKPCRHAGDEGHSADSGLGCRPS